MEDILWSLTGQILVSLYTFKINNNTNNPYNLPSLTQCCFRLENKLDLSTEDEKYKDFKFTKWLSKNVKLQGIPYSVFFSEGSKTIAEDYVRFCFFKVICFK